MNKLYLFLGFIGAITMVSCANRNLGSNKMNNQKEFSQLFNMMAGEFSSAEQAQEESRGRVNHNRGAMSSS